MLRAVLGICGVGLIAFGVFGGSALESMHRSISGVFTPDTVVVAEVPQSEEVLTQAVEATEEVVAEVVPTSETVESNVQDGDANMIVLASATADSGALLKTATTDATAVLQTKSDEVVGDPVPVAAAVAEEVLELPAESVASTDATKPMLEALESADLKAEGVEIVLTSTTGVPPNDTLFVLKERVNMREGPSTKHPIVLQLDVGQELMEFKRDGKWVHVGAYGTAGKIGWVHNTLVGSN